MLQTWTEHFESPAASMQLELNLLKFLSVTAPFAKALLCLESAHSTVSDVYVMWLSVMATLEELLKKNSAGLDSETIGDIKAIANHRFNQMCKDGPTDVYLTGFFLDPRKRNLYNVPA